MDYIKFTTTNNNEVIVNMSNIAYLYQVNEKQTNIVYAAEESFLIVNLTVRQIINMLDNKGIKVHVFS
jgi:hypothetical protein